MAVSTTAAVLPLMMMFRESSLLTANWILAFDIAWTAETSDLISFIAVGDLPCWRRSDFGMLILLVTSAAKAPRIFGWADMDKKDLAGAFPLRAGAAPRVGKALL